jgi:hypothetical protein
MANIVHCPHCKLKLRPPRCGCQYRHVEWVVCANCEQQFRVAFGGDRSPSVVRDKLMDFDWFSDAAERECPTCGAKVGQQCSDENGCELATKIHPARDPAHNTEVISACRVCGGTGTISYNPNLNPNAFPASASAKCSCCDGTGMISDEYAD